MKKIMILLITLMVISIGFLSGCNEQTAIEQENKLPTVSCSATSTEGVAPLTVNFVGLGSDSDGIIVSYYWDFGDGKTSNARNPTHTFYHDGDVYSRRYTVKLTVTDDKGATDDDYEYISITGVKMTVVDDFYSRYSSGMNYQVKVETCFDINTKGCYELQSSKVGEKWETCWISGKPDEILAGDSDDWYVIFKVGYIPSGYILKWKSSYGTISAYV